MRERAPLAFAADENGARTALRQARCGATGGRTAIVHSRAA